MSRGRSRRTGAVVRELRAMRDGIIGAIERASAEQKTSREAMAESMLEQGAHFLRSALDAGSAAGIGRVPANDAASSEEPPPSSGPRPGEGGGTST